MLKIKNEKGITLIVLILTMLLLIIIAAISIDYAYDGIMYSKERRMLTEVEEVQQAVMEKYTELTQLKIENNEDSYDDFAETISTSDLSKYSDILKHTYDNTEDIEPSKRYYTISADQMKKLDIEIKNGIPDDRKEMDILKNSNGNYVLYIVNFYYGEVLNIYYSEDFKIEHSNQLLYTLGRTSEIDLSTALGTLNWNDSISLDEKDGLEISVDSEYNRDGRGIITFNILNKSNSTKILDNIDIYSEDKIEEAKMYSSNYTNNYKADGEENNITVSLSDYGKNNYSGIGPGRSANIKIVIYYDEAPSGNISILNYNCK